ncbi:MAG: O-antigen ligase family protein [bacterium]
MSARESDADASRFAFLLRYVGLVGILAVASIRTMVSVEPNVWFADVDPARDPMPLLAFGAAKSHMLDLVLFVSAAIALFGEARAKRGVRTGLVLLALLPVPVAFIHARTGIVAENGFRADTWIAAMLAFVALAHLVRDRAMRAAALAVLLGVIALLAVRGAVQVFIEHPATVAHFEATRDEFFAARGWLPDSSAARSYERRLMQPEATGWFGLSNPFSTMMGVGVVGFAALAIVARRMQQSGNTLLLAVAACACGALLFVNGGKGAIGATVIGAAVLVFSLRRGAPISARWMLVLPACMLAVVGARWLVGTRINELSLLFRGYYIEAGLNILSKPEWFIFGCGPDRVQEFFNAAKPANCPEDVKSLHSIFFDWFVAFGVSGFAWIGLVVAMFWSKRAAGADADAPTRSEAEGRVVARLALAVAVGAGFGGMLLAATVEAPIFDAYWIATRLLGVCAFALLAWCAAQAALVIPEAMLRATAFAIGVIVLVHAQIETVAWMPGSCVLALAFIACATHLGVGASGASLARAAERRFEIRVSNELAVVALGLLAVLSMSFGLLQDFSRAARVDQVARAVAAIAEEPAREYDARMDAARQLSANDFAWSRFELEASVMQALAAAAVARGPGADADAPIGEGEMEAIRLAEKNAWRRQLRGPRATALRADVALAIIRRAFTAGEASGSDGWNEFALLRVVEDGAKAMPRNPRRWIAVGDARRILRDGILPEEIADPREAYERAYIANEQLSLDPLAQLSPRELAMLEAQLGIRPTSGEWDPQG